MSHSHIIRESLWLAQREEGTAPPLNGKRIEVLLSKRMYSLPQGCDKWRYVQGALQSDKTAGVREFPGGLEIKDMALHCYCCDSGSIPVPGTSVCCGSSPNQKNQPTKQQQQQQQQTAGVGKRMLKECQVV